MGVDESSSQIVSQQPEEEDFWLQLRLVQGIEQSLAKALLVVGQEQVFGR
jgi:hypothetical protein